MVRVAVPALMLATLLLLPAGQAKYENLEFTKIVEDASGDYAPFGFQDIVAVSAGEPGDQSVVFKIEARDLTNFPSTPCTVVPGVASAGCSSIQLWFTAAGTGFRSGVNPQGEPGSTNPFDQCEADAGVFYCAMKYSTLKLAKGDVIEAPYVITYYNVAQDVGPGNLYADEYAKGATVLPKGTSYTLKGSTLKAGTGPGTTPQVVETNVTTQAFKLDVTEATPRNGTAIYHWNGAFNPVDVAYVVNGTGSVSITALDGAGKTAWEGGAASETKQGIEVTAGKWTITVKYTSFKGTMKLDVTEAAASNSTGGPSPTGGTGGPAPTSGPGSTTGPGNATGPSGTTSGGAGGDEDKGTPGLGVLAFVAALAVALVAVRRRLE